MENWFGILLFILGLFLALFLNFLVVNTQASNRLEKMAEKDSYLKKQLNKHL